VTAAELFLRHRDRDDTAFHFEDRTISYGELVDGSLRRLALWRKISDPSRPPHIAVLLDNTAEYVFWLGAAAIVGVNSTYRGEELARLIRHTDSQAVVLSDTYGGLLEGLDIDVPSNRVIDVTTDAYGERLATFGDVVAPTGLPGPDDLYLLIFTSGSTSFPKAVRCTQGRFARTGGHVATVTALGDGDAVYSPLPFFHSSSLFTGMASALTAGVPLGTRSRFSASQTLGDIRRIGATVMTYTGKVLNYILAVPPRSDDLDNPLRLAIGNEASFADIRDFSARFGADVRDSYGSTEGVIIVRRDPSMPPGALGTADADIVVLDPETGEECPPAAFGPDGALLNSEAASGELVNLDPGAGFEGYYRNQEATEERFRGGRYWSGDLAYRDAEGWLYFAGRTNEWLRVDGENFAAGSVETIISRFPKARSIVVYAVPDDPVGDAVMTALEIGDPSTFDINEFDEFLRAQPDLGPKWIPTFVLVSPDLPKLASLKIDKTRLRREAWTRGSVYWRPKRGAPLEPLSHVDADALARRLA
jgi:fatty-acyl-CoA synthase